MKLGQRKENIHETPDASHIRNPDVAHEASDVNVKALLQFTVGLFIFCVLSAGLMWLLFRVLQDRAERLEPPPAPMALSGEERLPPEPRLQGAPGFGAEGRNLELMEPQAEMKVVRERWNEILERGAIDPQTGTRTAIPIEEAKRKLLAEGGGLTTRQQPEGAQPSALGYDADMPSYQSSGRQMEKRNK